LPAGAQNLNFSNTMPAAPSNAVNVAWQHDTSSPVNLSAYLTQAQINSLGIIAGSLSGSPTSGQYWGYNGTAQGWYTPTGSGTVNNCSNIGYIAYYAATGTAVNCEQDVPIANGGTGQTTQQAAMDALAGAQTAAQFLRGNGTHVVMSAIQVADVPTLNQPTTGNAGGLAGSPTNGQYWGYNGTAQGWYTPSGSGGDTITSPLGTVSVAGTSSNTTIDLLKFNPLTADPASCVAGQVWTRTDLGALKFCPASTSIATTGSDAPDLLPTSSLYAQNTGAPIHTRAIAAFNQVYSATSGFSSPSTQQQMVPAFCCDSLDARAPAPNRNTWNLWAAFRLWQEFGYGGSGWVDAVGGSGFDNYNLAPYSTSVTTSPASTSSSASWTVHFEGLQQTNGTATVDTRAPWGPAVTDLNCNTGDSCSITVQCGTVTGYACTRMIAVLHQQSGGQPVTVTLDSVAITGSPFATALGTAGAPVYADTGAVTAGAHTLLLSGTGPWDISGVDTINGTTGVKVERIAMGAATICDYNAVQSATGNIATLWTKLGITSVHIMASTNEQVRSGNQGSPYGTNLNCAAVNGSGGLAAYGWDRTPAQFESDLAALVTTAQGLSTQPDVSISTDPDNWYSDDPTASGAEICGLSGSLECLPMQPYEQAMLDYAQKNPAVGVVDAYALSHPWNNLCKVGASSCSNTVASEAIYADAVHWESPGQWMYANAWLNGPLSDSECQPARDGQRGQRISRDGSQRLAAFAVRRHLVERDNLHLRDGPHALRLD
jgi:hypothetical protein